MDLTAFLGSKFAGNMGAGIGQGIGEALGGGGGPMITGGPVDSRSFMDGSGWTVSTGSSKATGARQEGRGAGGFGAGSVAQPAPMAMAGMGDSPWTILLMLAFGYAVWRSR